MSIILLSSYKILQKSCRIKFTKEFYIFREIKTTSLLFSENTNSTKHNSKNVKTLVTVPRARPVSNSLVKRKINEVYGFYEEVSGMDEVRMAQDKVILIQDELKLAQDRRREILHELSIIRKDLQLLHNDILNCGRGESRYLDLVRSEIDVR